ncbi:MAG: GxxExxY protein [Candidatus Harrisonbacteria bacterium CG10_big_fil_rev_8_21_14_0_10_44_23]|uniref:GxxExxY protein n=1 Tax=Candidatus Harrisonbacteria bacterium CG10_big_fil_rev_8_21_14_0_10_44_23 TaxID=1974585 RepID=A0A2H0UQG8_9BACT|nr:MAG: GxxExxY protein [Candidatus Harrisonbacteria bacterium CG10_big_fil_rev_8_21_14_0_10_44_23]
MGWGLAERDYQRALASEFVKRKIDFKEQVYIPLKYKGEVITKYFADFVVENKILIELKVVHKLGYSNAKQVLAYLRSSRLKLGLLVYFTREGAKYRRVLNSAV